MAIENSALLWIDLEMTGLDPVEDRILEVAAVVTDWNLKEIATYQGVKNVEESRVRKRMFESVAAKEFWEKNPETRDSLVQQNMLGHDSESIENELIAFIDDYFPLDEKVILAGNSIHQDRKFIDNEWPNIASRLHYRMLDVSAWKVVFEGKYKKKYAKPETHRALSDIRGSIEELKYYLKKVKA